MESRPSLQLVAYFSWELREDKDGWDSLLIKDMLDNCWLDIVASSFQNLDCLAFYSFTLVTKDIAQKLDHLQPDSLFCSTAEAAHEPEVKVLFVLS